MRNILRSRFFGDKSHFWPVILISAVILLFGCQAKEAPLSPGAAVFKKEIKSCLTNLAVSLVNRSPKRTWRQFKAALAKAESPA